MSAHQVGDEMRTGFPADSATAVTIVPDAHDLTAAESNRYTTDLARVPGVAGVSPVRVAGGSAYLTVRSTAPVVVPGSFGDNAIHGEFGRSERQAHTLAGERVDVTGRVAGRRMTRRHRMLTAGLLHASTHAWLRPTVVPAAEALPNVFGRLVNLLAR